MEELFGGVNPATKAKLQEMAAASTSRAQAAANQTRPAAILSHADLDDGSDSGEKAPLFEAKETTKALESGFKVSPSGNFGGRENSDFISQASFLRTFAVRAIDQKWTSMSIFAPPEDVHSKPEMQESLA